MVIDDNDTDLNFRIERPVLQGRYWVKINSRANLTGSYELNSSFTPAGPEFTQSLSSESPDGEEWTITVATSIGFRYYVQKSATMTSGWERVTDIITADSEQTVFTIPTTETREFYSIVTLQP